MFSQPKTDSVTRSVASVTLDGRKLTAEVSILLHRAMGRSDAEALATQVAGIVDDILGAQIVQGQIPLTASELETLTLAKAKGLGKVARVRITSLRLSVPPATGHVPSVRPAPSKPPDPRAATSHESGTRPGPTATQSASPPAASVAPRSPTSSMPPRSPAASMPPRSPISSVPPRAPAASMPPRSPAAGASSPPLSPPAPSMTSPTPSRPPERGPSVEAYGAALAHPLRDAAARAVLSALSAVTGSRVDRLSLLSGKSPAEELCREVCACFAASIYGECVARGESHKLAAAKVEAVCEHAFPDASGPSATEIGFYIAIAAPPSELATRLATILGCESDSQLLRAALTSCHASFNERIAMVHDRLS
ncbi:MAG TPA: hypothetical protein VHC69_15400 [Polyangiaceae bacterium]|nr:hypothetical protein [Polyangiaceae bacterium]